MLPWLNIGLVGLIFILVAWIPDTIKSLKRGRVSTRFEFLILYIVGSFLLTLHALNIGDVVFLVLNGLATIMATINLVAKIQNSLNSNKREK